MWTPNQVVINLCISKAIQQIDTAKKPNIYNDSHFLRPNKQIVKEGKYKFHIFNDKTNYTNNT